MLLRSSMLITLRDWVFLRPISSNFLVQESIKGEVAGRSRYAGRSFAFGDGSFLEVTAL